MSLTHELLGQMRGKKSKDGTTIQYRGIKYANIPGRWQDPVMISGTITSSGSEFDATKHGLSCPQHSGGHAFDLSLVGNVTLAQESTEQSEFECLNLVVTTPAGTKPEDKLPVFVWVHGGGFSIGSSSWPQYDIASLISSSVMIGQPVISVSINYRVGIFGFLASDSLKVSGNAGVKDIACAFKWVKKHIPGFGGDPTRVTAVGESAGSILIATLLVSAEKDLFQQAVMMSGDLTLRRPRSMTWQNSLFETNVRYLGLDNLSHENRNKILRNMKAEDIVQKLRMFQQWSPTIDGSYIKHEVTLGDLADPQNPVGKPAWCKRIMVGDTGDDGTILKARIMDNPNIISRLHGALRETFSVPESKNLLKAYSLLGNITPEQQYEDLLNLLSDLRFYLPVLLVEKGWRGKKDQSCLKYHFHQQNPVQGLYSGLASHELDVAYLLQNFPKSIPSDHQRLGRSMAEAWIRFTYGEGWGNEIDNTEVMVIGPDEKINHEFSGDYDVKYRGGRGQLLTEIGWEKCFKLAELLQGVAEERLKPPSKL